MIRAGREDLAKSTRGAQILHNTPFTRIASDFQATFYTESLEAHPTRGERSLSLPSSILSPLPALRAVYKHRILLIHRAGTGHCSRDRIAA